MATPTTSLSLVGKPCPCGSGKNFENCCGPVIDGSRPAATAEELMRSRFTAHVIQDHGYLHRTYEGTRHRKFVDEPDSSPIQWTRLEVHSHDPEVRPDVAHVDFSAYFHEEGAEHAIQEKSEFHRVKGAWYYTKALRSGPAPLKSSAPKVGRNDPCPCGSGKKYKNCHLGKPL